MATLLKEFPMIRHISTDKAPPAFSNYSQAVAAPSGAETIYISGQVGVDLQGIWQKVLAHSISRPGRTFLASSARKVSGLTISLKLPATSPVTIRSRFSEKSVMRY